MALIFLWPLTMAVPVSGFTPPHDLTLKFPGAAFLS